MQVGDGYADRLLLTSRHAPLCAFPRAQLLMFKHVPRINIRIKISRSVVDWPRRVHVQVPPSDRLLEGEDPRTIFPQDARHWIAVYREMIGFKDELLDRIRNLLAGLPPAARQDVIDNDVGLIEEQLERYRRRLEYWYARQWDLEGLHVDEETRTLTYRESAVALTRREYQILHLLVERSPNFVSPSQLLVQAWHDSQLPEETLRTYIGRVRSKLLTLGVEATIHNRPRRGYALMFKERPNNT